MDPVLEIKGLEKQFKTVKAVDGLDLAIEKGTIYGFLGQNGAGKTTTLRMITNLARPTQGTIRVCGQPVVFGSGRTNASIGYLPDVPQFYDWMKPMEYLSLCGKLYGMDGSAVKTRATELMEMVGLAGVKRNIKGFSRGMKQRLGIAQALMHDPEILLLDEPTSALDPLGRKEVLDIIKALGGRHTVVFSTHILSDVERICDRVGILHHGKLALEGTLGEISARYSTQGALLEVDGTPGEALAARLSAISGVQSVQVSPAGSYLIKTADFHELSLQLCPLLSEMNLPIQRFEFMESTLEDVFVEVIGT